MEIGPTVPREVIEQCLKNNVLTEYEFTALVGIRGRQIEEGSTPTVLVPPGVDSPIQIAAEEYYVGRIPLSVRRFYFVAGRRYEHTFPVSALRERKRSLMHIRTVTAAPNFDINGKPPVFHYLTDEEIAYVAELIMVEAPPEGFENQFISNTRGPTKDVMHNVRTRTRVSVTENLRLYPCPNDQLSLHRLAASFAMAHNLGTATPCTIVGPQLANAVVETQGVISSFHNAGKKLSALKALEATAAIIKGKSLDHSDFLVFGSSVMTPFVAMTYAQRFTDVKVSDVLLGDVAVLPISRIASSEIHQCRMSFEQVHFDEVGSTFLRMAFDTTKLAWHHVALQSICKKIRRNLEESCVVVPSVTSRGYIDILVRNSINKNQSHALSIKAIECLSVNRVFKKWTITDGVRGINGYVPDVKRATQFVLKETARNVEGSIHAYMLQINRQELELLLRTNPYPTLLKAVDPDSTFTWMPTGVEEDSFSHQAMVTVNAEGIRRTIARIEEMREVNRTAFIAVSLLEDPTSRSDAEARISARQMDISNTPMSVINALADEIIMSNDITQQADLVKLLQGGADAADWEHHLALARAIHTRADRTPAEDLRFIQRFRITCLVSDGTNYLDNIRILPGVEARRCYPINPRDTYMHLGAEACRFQLLRTFITQFSISGKKADPRHLELIADVMMHTGILTNLEDLAIGDVGGSVFRNAMRGRATAVFRTAAMKDATDSAPGILASHLVGTRVCGGTGGIAIVPNVAKRAGSK
jgi:DNA-directed RNA polymerase subunit K/omega